VKGYYTRFLAALPTVQALADCPEEQLLKLWEGLGYYNRARNLQKAAKILAETGFPDSYEGWLSLPGVGEYTAGAVASICFDRPVAAVDGNVLRVLSRYRADDAPITDSAVKKRVKAELEEIYPKEQPGTFTQALMELGATVCVPNGAPHCEVCPLSAICMAHKEGIETELPIKTPKKPRRVEEMTVFLLHSDDGHALRKRPETGLLAGLWEFPHVPGKLELPQVLEQLEQWGIVPIDIERSVERTHIFTHVQWDMRGWHIHCRARDNGFIWKKPEIVALPTAFRLFLE
jgi:A/G-specific adenine glycosylase